MAQKPRSGYIWPREDNRSPHARKKGPGRKHVQGHSTGTRKQNLRNQAAGGKYAHSV